MASASRRSIWCAIRKSWRGSHPQPAIFCTLRDRTALRRGVGGVMTRIGIVLATGTMLACGTTAASSQSFTGDYAIFVGATPLWDSGASHADLGKVKFKIWIDNALQKGDCDAFVDVDNGWICKSSNKVAAGKH